MLFPNDIPRYAGDRLLAAGAALVVIAVLLATALVPASPAIASSIIFTGALA